LLGGLVPGIAVGMALEGDLAVGLLDLGLARITRDAQHLVEIAAGHATWRSPPARAPPPHARHAVRAPRAGSPSGPPGAPSRARRLRARPARAGRRGTR